jgi:radical SAM protein
MWESTIACGLLCKHCKASAKKMPDPDELSKEEGFDLIDQITEFGKPYPILRITGGNALMRKDIFELIRYGKEKGLTVTIAPSTTPLLNKKNIEKLKQARTDTVALSIDGPNAQVHDSFRGVKGTFDMLIKATETMKKVDLPFRLLTTVTKFNVHNLPEIFFLSKKLGAIGWYLYMLIPTGRATKEYQITPMEHEDVFNFIYDVMRSGLMNVNAIAGAEPYRRVAVMRRLVEKGLLEKEKLMQGKLYRHLASKLGFIKGKPYHRKIKKRFGKGIFVSNNGFVHPSSFLPMKIGSVRKERLKGIYQKDILRDLQDPKKLKGKCKICEFNDVCRGSRSRAYALTGDYLAEDPYCVYVPGTVEKRNNKAILEELEVTNFSRPILNISSA